MEYITSGPPSSEENEEEYHQYEKRRRRRRCTVHGVQYSIEVLFLVFSFDNFFCTAMIWSVPTMISMLSLARYLPPLMIWCQPFVGEIKAKEVGTTYKRKTLATTLFFTANIFWNGIKYTIHFTTIGLYSEQDNIWTCKNISQQISMHQKSNLFPQHISMHKKTNL